MITVFSSPICPYAQRTIALLERQGEPYERRAVDLADRDPELLELSPTGKVPFLVDGDFKLFESQVINDYLAEKLGFESAYAQDLESRSLQKLMMRQWDASLVPAFYRSLRDPECVDAELRASLKRELAWMQTTIEGMGGEVDNLLGLHCATHWARMEWMREDSPAIPTLVDEFGVLRAWLARAAELPVIMATLPEREASVARYREHFGPKPGSKS